MSTTMTHESHASTHGFASANARESADDVAAPSAVSGTPRLLLRLEAGAVLAIATSAYAWLGGHWLLFAVLFLAPDLAMLGYRAGTKIGAASYNAVHSYLGPALLAAVGLLLSHGLESTPPSALLVACIWAAHIGFDRLLGYGLKYGSAFGDTHLGLLPAKGSRPAR